MIETTITKIQYDADGVQRRWSIPFQYADVKHISIYTKVGEEPTVKVVDNYDIDEDDSVVIYPTVASGQEPLAAGTKIIIARETPETQLEDASQVHFTSKDVERGLDKLTMITQELSTTASETMEVSADAFEAAEEAVNSAAQANNTAEEAKTIAEQAVGIATDAKSIAEGIDAKATQALTNSNTAVNTANSAKEMAENIDSKATQALANSTTALEKATEAKNTADSYQGQITTLRNDVDDLGDQLAGYLPVASKAVANGVASLDANGKVPAEQIPVATTSTLGGVKPDGTTITVTEDGTISAESGSGFDFEGTKAEFDAAVAAGTITADSVSLITDDVSGDNVATKAELQNRVSKAGDTMTGQLQMTVGSHGVRFNVDDTKFFFIESNSANGFTILNQDLKGIYLDGGNNGMPVYTNGTNGYRLLTTADIDTTINRLNWSAMTTWNANSVAPARGMAVFGGWGSDQQVYLKFQPAGSSQVYEINCGYNNDAGLSGTFLLNPGDKAWTSNGCAGYFVPFAQ